MALDILNVVNFRKSKYCKYVSIQSIDFQTDPKTDCLILNEIVNGTKIPFRHHH